MSSQSNLLQVGVVALQQKRYADAIQALELFCSGQATPGSNSYFQAQMYLVKAYQDNGQQSQAITLCRQMTQVENPQIRTWAERILPTLKPLGQSDTDDTEPLSSGMSTTSVPAKLSEAEAEHLFTQGGQAFRAHQFTAAIAALKSYCDGVSSGAKNYAQASMWLVKAYEADGQTDAAIAHCQSLLHSDKEYLQIWAKQALQRLAPELSAATADAPSEAVPSEGPMGNPSSRQASPATPSSIPKSGRSQRLGVKLSMRGVAASLSLASGVTISLLFGMILVLCLAIMLIVESDNPTAGFVIGATLAIAFNLLTFFLAPFIMDLMQGWFYQTRWIDLNDLERHSPEAARVIREVCQRKKLHEPRLGLIEDDNPTAFTYGSLPNSARLVVSRGLLKYLDDDEIATVYAHELGHIVHWDFAVMTLAATLVQLTYFLYVYIDELAERFGGDDSRIRGTARSAAIAAYIFYIVGEYLLLYLSRTREYYADHFAAEVTGNPNGLSRALVKIAYGILEEGKRSEQPSKMLAGTRALGIADAKSAAFTGTAYRVASDPQKVGRVFLWDMFNPWAGLMELNSTHPLTGKRVRALSTYAEQLGLETEFDMARVVREGRTLNKRKLYGNFVGDVIAFCADWIGVGLGLLAAGAIFATTQDVLRAASPVLLGLGLGLLIKMFFMYPDFSRAPETDVLALMSDPYASPLRGRPVKLNGQVIGRGDAGYIYGCDLKLQDPTGLIYLRYASRFGPLGNFLFGLSKADGLLRREASAVGWFRRGVMPWVDLVKLEPADRPTVTSHPRFWLLVASLICLGLGFLLPNLA